MILKNYIRYYAGVISTKLGLNRLLKSIYILKASTFIEAIPSKKIRAAWIRRSLTTEDFVPFWSDIDLTILVSEASLSFPNDFLIKDIQFVPEFVFEDWKQAGGIRTKPSEMWLPLLADQPMSSASENSHLFLAFEISHELELIYRQIEEKFHQWDDPFTIISKQKLELELFRLEQMWNTKNYDILHVSRKELSKGHSTTLDFSNLLSRVDQLSKKLLENLPPPLNQYCADELICGEHEEISFLSLEIQNKKVVVVKNNKSAKDVILKYPEYFVTTLSYVQLIKGIGIQEQTLLNQLAKDNSYYYKFQRQRLATDLLGALIATDCTQVRFYYCFKNIEDFHESLSTKRTNLWHLIEEKWHTASLIFSNSDEKLTLGLAYLDVLRSLR